MSLRDLAQSQGLSVPALSKLSGVSPRAIEEYMSGRRSISNAQAHIVIALADALHVHPRDLIAEPPK